MTKWKKPAVKAVFLIGHALFKYIMQIKIAQVVCVFPPYKSGIGNVAAHFARLAAAAGHAVTVFTPRYRPVAQEQSSAYRVMRLWPILKRGNAALLPGLLYKIRDFDLVHLHYPFFGGAEPVFLSKAAGGRFKLAIHYHMDAGRLPLVSKLFGAPGKLLIKPLFNRADVITCASLDYLKHSAIKDYVSRYPEKFAEIPFGTDTEFFLPVPPAGRENTVLFVGGLDTAHNFKGIDVLLKAFAKLKQSARLVIVGDGDRRPAYEKMTINLGLQRRVEFTGRVSDRELAGYYRRAALLVLPSVNRHEAFGLVLLEAMACGTPVIASALPGVRSVFTDGRQGFLVKPGDENDLGEKIDRLLGDPGLRKKMGKAARELAVNKYDWSRVKDALEAVYRRLVNQ